MRARSATHKNVGASLDHLAGPAAVLVEIVQPVRSAVVDQYGSAALHGNPSVRTATGGMDPAVAHSEGRLVVDEDVGRSGDRRTNARMRAAAATVNVGRDEGAITEP
jgi:hypothetical protein